MLLVPMLLVLDNCDHLVEAAAGLVAGLVRSPPGLRWLPAASRRGRPVSARWRSAPDMRYRSGPSNPDGNRSYPTTAGARTELKNVETGSQLLEQPPAVPQVLLSNW